MGKLSITGQRGDTRISWDAANEQQVKDARRTFDDLKKLGYLAFAVTADGSKGEQVSAFDPATAWVIMIPPMAGGR